ncbi:3-isopropylmalate dehydrogenase [Fluviispira multicolorata]|uniref:3-isopropylmalate dehydrogenase n=1 Tax=Fluviispira multicolorata TaxID=2654512 RepID=A0A833JEE1_9BACT|nr:3-isopropylmalate dehydrogenase [Fluviispira multicolorata]KAB8033171.1 3-isopropylmalate dehydrogenase [Fluviispira multicolorata]
MNKTIAVLAGDGIGPEVMEQTIRVLNTIEKKFNHQFEVLQGLIGGSAYDKFGTHFPEATKFICQRSHAILFGSVGGPVNESHHEKWKNCEKNSILSLRKEFQFSSNIRPAKVYAELKDICPLKDSIIKNGIDIVIVRELLGDIYFGEHRTYIENQLRKAIDTAEYDEKQIEIVAHQSFKLALMRKNKVTSVDKANVLDTSKLWREVLTEIGKQYPTVTLEHMLVDNCAMQFFINPCQFDVIVTANLFGDILSDAAAAFPGSLGLMPSASFNEKGFGLFEPSGGSAPDIAGKNIANPIAQIMSLAMLLRQSFELIEEASCIENAVQKALQAGYRTCDISANKTETVTTEEMTNRIIEFI